MGFSEQDFKLPIRTAVFCIRDNKGVRVFRGFADIEVDSEGLFWSIVEDPFLKEELSPKECTRAAKLASGLTISFDAMPFNNRDTDDSFGIYDPHKHFPTVYFNIFLITAKSGIEGEELISGLASTWSHELPHFFQQVQGRLLSERRLRSNRRLEQELEDEAKNYAHLGQRRSSFQGLVGVRFRSFHR